MPQPLFSRLAVEAGELIGEVPTEAAANVEVGVAALGQRSEAVVGLRGVGNEVFQIAGVVDGVRPHEVGLRREPMPAVDAERGLQRVVGGEGARLFLVEVEEIRIRGSRNVAAAVEASNGTIRRT